jgi:hypothetical protein
VPVSTRSTQAEILSDASPFQGADIAAILADTGTDLPASIAALPTAADNADATWDELLTGASHNITNSAGKRVRQLNEATVAAEANVVDASPGVSSFDTDLTEVDGFWQDTVLIFVAGALTGQARTIAAYANASGNVSFDEDLTSAPANGDSFLLLASHVHPVGEIADAVWEELSNDHLVGGTMGKSIDNIETAVQTSIPNLIIALNDIDGPTVAAATWGALVTTFEGTGSFGRLVSDLFGEHVRTKLYFAVSAISTGGREVPQGAVSHMEVQVRASSRAFGHASQVDYFVVFGYNAGDPATTAPRVSNTETAAPTDGSFTSTPFPT